MAASPILVDSSFYIRSMREGVDPLRRLTLPSIEQDLLVCGVVRCEVSRGLRQKAVQKRFQAFWDVMINIPTDAKIWTAAEELLWNLDRQGVMIPLTDAVIACCAMRAGASVLTHDIHFHQIPGLRVIDQIQY